MTPHTKNADPAPTLSYFNIQKRLAFFDKKDSTKENK